MAIKETCADGGDCEHLKTLPGNGAPESQSECLGIGYTREHERAEGLAKELVALRAQMATTLVFAPPDATHKCVGKCGTFWDCRYNADQKDCPNCGGQLIPAAQASSAATARVAELEKQLAAKDERIAALIERKKTLKSVLKSMVGRGDEHRARADAAEGELARLRALPDEIRDELTEHLPHLKTAITFLADATELIDSEVEGAEDDIEEAQCVIDHANESYAVLEAFAAAPLPSAQQIPSPAPLLCGEPGFVMGELEPYQRPCKHSRPCPVHPALQAAPAQPEGAPLAPPSSPQARFIAQLPLAEDAPGIDPDYDDPALAQPQEKK